MSDPMSAPSSSPLHALLEKWREHSDVARTNSQKPTIALIDQRQCFGVHQAYEACANELEATLTAAPQTPEKELTSAVDAVSQAAARRADVMLGKIELLRTGALDTAKCLKAWSESWWFDIMRNYPEALKCRDAFAREAANLERLVESSREAQAGPSDPEKLK